MILTTLNESEIVDRILVLPEPLQGTLEDAATKKFVDEVASAVELAPEYLSMFETLVSVVLMGFLRPEGLAAEFQELGLDPVTAIAAAEKIDKEIFQPVRTEIATAALLPREAPETDEISGPTLDLKSSMPRPAPLPQAITPKPVEMPSAPVSAPVRPNTPTAPNPGAAPFMLQKEAVAERAVANSGFKLDIDPKIFNHTASTASAPSVPVPQHARPAELELGKDIKKTPSAPINRISTAPTQRVVHYTDVNSSLGVAPAPAIKPVAPKPIAAPIAAPATPPNKPATAPQIKPVTPTFAAKPAGLPTPSAQPSTAKDPLLDLSKSVKPSPFSLGSVVGPETSAPSFLKNAPGVPPPLPESKNSPNTQTGDTTPKPAQPPRVVNFTAPDSSVK